MKYFVKNFFEELKENLKKKRSANCTINYEKTSCNQIVLKRFEKFLTKHLRFILRHLPFC